PAPNAFADDSLAIAATVNSTYSLQSVSATIADRVSSLTFSTCAFTSVTGLCVAGWGGSISLVGLSKGPQTLTITANDVLSHSASSSRSIIYNQRPRVVVEQPANDTVARPGLRVRASCSDDGPQGCTLIEVKVGGTRLASGITSIDQII